MPIHDFVDRETTRTVGVIIASVLIFNSLPKLQFVGQFFEKYPYATLGLGVLIVFLIFKNK